MSASDSLRAVPPAVPGERAPAVRLLHAMPDWEHAIPVDDRTLAMRALRAPVATADKGIFDPGAGASACNASGSMLVIDGVLLRNTYVRGRVATEIIGAGDVIDTGDDVEPSLLATTTEYVVHRVATVAFLDERFAAATRRWPALRDAVDEQVGRQRRRGSAHLAILQLPRVEDRIVALFTLLADRWGRVTPGGVVVDLPLTHELIGQLVGGRRPTVTLALATLGTKGAIARQPDGRWLLAREAITGP
jgi:CRP-like cAMP-binding protein